MIEVNISQVNRASKDTITIQCIRMYLITRSPTLFVKIVIITITIKKFGYVNSLETIFNRESLKMKDIIKYKY